MCILQNFQFPLWDTARVDFGFVFGYPRGAFYLIFNAVLGL
jgi:hypothetical protein